MPPHTASRGTMYMVNHFLRPRNKNIALSGRTNATATLESYGLHDGFVHRGSRKSSVSTCTVATGC